MTPFGTHGYDDAWKLGFVAPQSDESLSDESFLAHADGWELSPVEVEAAMARLEDWIRRVA